MRTQEKLRQECQKLCARRYKELGLSEGVRVKDLLPEDYVLSEDKEELVELLNYSLGLSKLWMEYCQANPTRQPTDVNKVILRYMINMWGQDWYPPGANPVEAKVPEVNVSGADIVGAKGPEL